MISEFTIINLMSNVFFVFQLFQKKGYRSIFFESLDIFFYFENYCIKSPRELIILIADVRGLDMLHYEKNEI